MWDALGMMFMFIGIGIMIAITKWSKAGFPGLTVNMGSQPRRIPVAYRADPAQQKLLVDAYKHAVTEKMDVMRQAIAMGWGDEELKRLDARLEQLIGKDELKRILDGEMPQEMATQPLDASTESAKLRGVAQG